MLHRPLTFVFEQKSQITGLLRIGLDFKFDSIQGIIIRELCNLIWSEINSKTAHMALFHLFLFHQCCQFSPFPKGLYTSVTVSMEACALDRQFSFYKS